MATGNAGHDLVHCFNELRRRQQRIVPLIHGRRAGMIRKSVNGHIPPAIADDSFHHADVNLLGCERAPLLNVQFNVGKNVAGLAACAGQAIGITPDKRNPVCPEFSLADRLPSEPSADGFPSLFGHFVGTTRSSDSPSTFMLDLWFITFSNRPAHL